MAGLVPAIHAFADFPAVKAWMPGTRPGMTIYLENSPNSSTCGE